MHIETLQLYCDVVRLRSYSRAAEQNHVSQSAASQALAKLEGELGAVLLDRSQRPFAVTPEGQAFHEACLGILAAWEQAKAGVAETSAQIDGTVRLAAIYSIGVYAVSRYIQEFATMYPDAQVELECLHSHRVVEAVTSGESDVGILSYPPNDRDLVVVDLPAEPMIFVCHPRHRLARRKVIRPSDLKGEGFVAFDPALMIRRAIDRSLRHHGAHPTVVLEFDNIDTIKQAVVGGQGVSILPLPTVQKELDLEVLVGIPVGIPDMVRPLGIIYPRGRPLTPTVERFIEAVKGSGQRGKGHAVRPRKHGSTIA